VAAKCNITNTALKKISEVIWGLTIPQVDNEIIENYIEYLACPDVILSICHVPNTNPCGDSVTNPVVLNCELNITNISFNTSTIGADIVFNLGAGDIFGAKTPISYLWTYDTATFDLIGGTNSSAAIQLKLKAGKNLSTLTTPIRVDITDGNGCMDFKQCYFSGGVMRCNSSFSPCPNARNLTIAYTYTPCPKATNLMIH
jgi:hypothetical protein